MNVKSCSHLSNLLFLADFSNQCISRSPETLPLDNLDCRKLPAFNNNPRSPNCIFDNYTPGEYFLTPYIFFLDRFIFDIVSIFKIMVKCYILFSVHLINKKNMTCNLWTSVTSISLH